MFSGILFLVGLALAMAGGARMRHKPSRDDEQRWRGFLAMLAGLALAAGAYGHMVGD